MNFIDYIEESCKNIEDNHISYIFKKKLLDEMTQRANEITSAGLRDEKVIADLLADEFPDIEKQYKEFEKAEKASQENNRSCDAEQVSILSRKQILRNAKIISRKSSNRATSIEEETSREKPTA